MKTSQAFKYALAISSGVVIGKSLGGLADAAINGITYRILSKVVQDIEKGVAK